MRPNVKINVWVWTDRLQTDSILNTNSVICCDKWRLAVKTIPAAQMLEVLCSVISTIRLLTLLVLMLFTDDDKYNDIYNWSFNGWQSKSCSHLLISAVLLLIFLWLVFLMLISRWLKVLLPTFLSLCCILLMKLNKETQYITKGE